MAMLNNQRVILGMTISNDHDLGLVDIAYNSPQKTTVDLGIKKRKCVELDGKKKSSRKESVSLGMKGSLEANDFRGSQLLDPMDPWPLSQKVRLTP